MTRIALLTVGVCLAVPFTSLACGSDVKIPESRLRGVLQSALASGGAVLRIDSDASGYQRYIENGLERTFGKDMSALFPMHTCAIHMLGESRFSVHAFGIDGSAPIDALVQKIEQRSVRLLQIEEPTYYTFIRTDRAIVFLIAARESYIEVEPMFQEIARRFAQPR